MRLTFLFALLLVIGVGCTSPPPPPTPVAVAPAAAVTPPAPPTPPPAPASADLHAKVDWSKVGVQAKCGTVSAKAVWWVNHQQILFQGNMQPTTQGVQVAEILLTVKNLHPTKNLRLTAIPQNGLMVTDDLGNDYKHSRLPPGTNLKTHDVVLDGFLLEVPIVEGKVLHPDQEMGISVFCEPLSPKAKEFRLSLPGSIFGEQGILALKIDKGLKRKW